MRAGTREAITLTTVPSENDNQPDNHIPSQHGTSTAHADPVVVEHSESGQPATDTSHPLHGDAPAAPQAPTFAEFGVRDEIVRTLQEAGIERTFAIQSLTLPLALAGEDVIGQARTGMGKTLGFGVPLLQRIGGPGDGTPQALVVVPTRELCLQVTHDLTDASKRLGVRTVAVYGGRPYEPQIEALRGGADLVVGTPGRLLDLAEQRHLVLGKLHSLVLDEADEMLDLGFLPDIERILRMVPEQRHTMLFSATMPGPIINLARTFLTQPTHIRAENHDASAIHERTSQIVYRAHSLDKPELIARALQANDRGLTMIFARTKRTAQKVSDDLSERGFSAAAVHGDLGQGAREQALRAFRTGKIDVLVATDVAARGIDVEDVTHVINYQMPEDEKTYIHRIGRTGRAGKTGMAITLVDWDEKARWKSISDALGLDKPEPVETYSTSAHLFTDLGIPADATGRLPLARRTRAGLSAEPADTSSTKSRGRARTASSRQHNRRRSTAGADSAPAADGSHPTTNSNQPSGPGEGRPRRRRTRGGIPARGEPGDPQDSTGESTERSARRRRRRRPRRGAQAGTGNTPDTSASAD